ncbi:MAG: hypothetical protein JNM17_24570 [Archangium sp.]|nr:hypothetical protein [Archangium sp.]
MRSRPIVVVLLLVAAFFTAAACGPRPLTEKEICGAQGCNHCIGLNCTGVGTDAGP